MSIGLIGRKLGVTQVFQGDGTMVAVSVLAIEPNTVTRLRTTERDGYTAVQLGTESAKRLTKPEAGQLKDLPKAAQALATIREFRVDSVDDYEVGQTVALGDVFAEGDLVDVTGVSKGKGFAGATTSSAARRPTARTITASPARSAPARRRAASTRVSGWPAIWATSGRRSRRCGSSARTRRRTSSS
jgi:large subunit ribosomal protein L3